jgi:hypothetical protein
LLNLYYEEYMKAYLKKNPEEMGQIVRVYKTQEGTKRLEVRFGPGVVVDALAEEFEILAVAREEVLND